MKRDPQFFLYLNDVHGTVKYFSSLTFVVDGMQKAIYIPDKLTLSLPKVGINFS